MASSAELVVKIVTDASQSAKGIDQATGSFDKFKGGLQSLAAPAAGVLGAVVALGAGAISSASDLQQAMGGVDAVFGESAQVIKDWSKDAATAVGLSAAQYSEFASKVGGQLKNMGVPMEAVAGQTDEMIRLGADLAATYGGTTADAVSALSSALRGEADPAERYALSLNQTAVNARLAEQGLGDLEGEALSAAKAQAIMQLATEQAGGAVGMFASESDTLAGQQAVLTASWEDASAALGESLLPIITPMVAALGEFAQWVQKNASVITPLVVAIGVLAAGILALNIVMAANPIGLIIIAVAALVAGIIALWTTNEDFRNFFIGLWEGIASFFTDVWEGAQDVVAAVVAWFRSAWAAVAGFFQSTWAAVAGFFQGIWTGITSVVSSVMASIRSVVGTVAGWFSSVWDSAVLAVVNIITTLRGVFTSVFNAIMTPINAVINAFKTVVGWIEDIIRALGRIKLPDVFGAIGGILGGASFSVNGTAAPALFSARGAGVATTAVAYGGGGSSTTINVQGGLDSADAIARRIQQVLTSRDRRTGGVSIGRPPR